MRNRKVWKLSALALLGASITIAGCNGDDNGGPTPSPAQTPTPGGNPGTTATPTTTATPGATPGTTATPVAGVVRTSNLTLGNGQRAVLSLTTRGTGATGTLRVLASGALPQAAGGRAITYAFRVGTYQVSGTFTPPRGFSITGTDGGRPLFTMSGQIPTQTQTGSYTLSVNGQTESGVIPVVGSVSPTPVPTPIATPSGPTSSTLTFTPSAGSNFVSVPITTAAFSLISQVGLVGGAIQSAVGAGRAGIYLVLVGGAPTVGTTTTLGAALSSGGYIYNYLASGQIQAFVPESGSVTLTAISQSSATYRFDNAVYAANEGNIARGKVTVNGSITGPLIRR